MIETNFLGKTLKSPLVLASGILGTSWEIMDRAGRLGCGVVTTKSIGPIERKGHKNPTCVEIENGLYNAVGLPTPGYQNIETEAQDWGKICVPLNASIYGSSIEEYVTITEHVQRFNPAFIELNISCPNKDDGMEFAQSESMSHELVTAVKKIASVPIIPKLTPNCEDIAVIAESCEKAGADAICAINTVQREIVHPELNVPLLAYGKGGISGPIIRETALEKVREISAAVKIPILGTGGVTTGADAIEMIKAGATVVGVGTAVHYHGVDVFTKINNQIEEIMKKENISQLSEVRNA